MASMIEGDTQWQRARSDQNLGALSSSLKMVEAAVNMFVNSWLVQSSQDFKGVYTAKIILSEVGEALPNYEKAGAAMGAVASKLEHMKKAVGAV